MSFVFNYFLASFPRFLYFLAIFRISASEPISNSAAFPRSRPSSERERRQEARILNLLRAFWTQFGFAFSFVLTCLSLFSMTYWLRSYYFLFFPIPFSPARRNHSRHPLRLVAHRPLPTTMCPYHDHNNRLSHAPGFVKRKKGFIVDVGAINLGQYV